MTTQTKVAAGTIVGLILVGLGLGMYAIISATRPPAAADPHHVEISSVDLTNGKRDAVISARDMVPGDVVTTSVTVANPSGALMQYAMTRGAVSAGGASLAAELVLTIRTVGASCGAFDGAILFEGPLDQAAFGSEAQGRQLAPATAEILCFRAVLPRDASDELQGAATTVTLSFGANWQAATP